MTKFESMFIMILLVFGDAAMTALTCMATKGSAVSGVIMAAFIAVMSLFGVYVIMRHTEKEPETKKDRMDELEAKVDIQD